MPTDAEVDLACGVHLAWVHEDVVVLDVEADAYVLLVGAAPLLRPVRHGAGVSADPPVLNDLILAGLATPVRQPRRRPIPLARNDSHPSGLVPRGLRARALATALIGTVSFRRRNLSALVRTARRRSVGQQGRDLDRAVLETAAFEAVRPWVPYEGDCLQRSWMLQRHLHRCGLDADWVFGVRTWPFFAHCWVQVGDVVVGDSLDRVGGFTPIMVA